MRGFLNEWESVKSYATEANLIKAINKLGLTNRAEKGGMIVRTPEGRWTMIFLQSFLPNAEWCSIPHYGFKVVG